MISYVPFLKAKQNELKAMSELAPEVQAAISPFFDFPRKKGYTPQVFIAAADRIAESIKRNVGKEAEFYFDDFDLDQELKVDGGHPYAYILKSLKGTAVIPVLGLDRPSHNAAVTKLKRSGDVRSPVVAFRAEPRDFEDFDLNKGQIQTELDAAFGRFDEIDLVLDCRVCTGLDVATAAKQIAGFSKNFCGDYPVRYVIVTGSSIPASIAEILGTNANCIVARKELAIFGNVRPKHDHAPLVFGDYTVVTPFYSDVDLPPEIMQSIMTARFAYTFKDSHFFIRGSSVGGAKGYEQYFGLARTLCGKSFFRGQGYSSGDAYFHSKSQRIGKNCTPGAVVKPSVVAHITYMVLDAKL